MVKALQLELRTAYQVHEEMPERKVNFELENLKLQQENIVLQQENVRLLEEINDIKREYTNIERKLTKAYYKIHELKSQLHSSVSFGQVVMFIGALVVVFLLLYYGMGDINFSSPMTIENDTPVVENHR